MSRHRSSCEHRESRGSLATGKIKYHYNHFYVFNILKIIFDYTKKCLNLNILIWYEITFSTVKWCFIEIDFKTESRLASYRIGWFYRRTWNCTGKVFPGYRLNSCRYNFRLAGMECWRNLLVLKIWKKWNMFDQTTQRIQKMPNDTE